METSYLPALGSSVIKILISSSMFVYISFKFVADHGDPISPRTFVVMIIQRFLIYDFQTFLDSLEHMPGRTMETSYLPAPG